MKDLALRVVKQLSDHPDQADVQQSEQNGVLRLNILVAEADKGKIIGKQGKVIKAIRSVVAAAGAKAGRKTVVDID